MILGASVRAAAQSARRAAFGPLGGDLFADRDASEIAVCQRVDDYPAGLARVARDAPPGPWMYTGGLENHPALVDAVSQGRPLWGNCGRTLRAVRDPFRVAEALADAGAACPSVSRTEADVPRDGSWLRKPLRGSGGTDIRPWLGRDAGAGPWPEDPHGWYYQQRVDGTECGAVYVAAGGKAALLGVTRQLVGLDWTGASAFQYAGSVGPLAWGPEVTEQFGRVGEILSEKFDLCGLFGVDAVVENGCVWPVEVNPRYTASVEVLERTLEIQAISLHAEACLQGRIPQMVPGEPRAWCGKAVLFARRNFTVPPAMLDLAREENAGRDWPNVADIPGPGTLIKAGAPITTVLAEAENEERLCEELRDRASRVSTALGLVV